MGNQWAIMDDEGIIEQGYEGEMRDKFDRADEEVENWSGDLMLIEIHDITR